jgi:hypothetical protein
VALFEKIAATSQKSAKTCVLSPKSAPNITQWARNGENLKLPNQS